MDLINDLRTPISRRASFAITIGNFDGVHLGHQKVLSQLRTVALREKRETVVISFSNHPTEVLRPGQFVLKLCSNLHKIKLLTEQGVDHLVLLPFTQDFSQQPSEVFLERIQSWHPFQFLILGYDAAFGKDRRGDFHHIQKLSHEMGFQVEYQKEYCVSNQPISSRLIRDLLILGDIDSTSKLLGRRFSIYNPITEKTSNDVWKVDVSGLCLPPPNRYSVQIYLPHQATAYSGFAFISKDEKEQISLIPANIMPPIKVGSLVEVIF